MLAKPSPFVLRLRALVLTLAAVFPVATTLVACGAGGASSGSDEDDDDDDEDEDDDDGGGGGGGGGGTVPASGTVVLAANDLGMHCMDREFATFSILPPYNVVRAQVVRRTASGPVLLDSAGARVTYAAVADASGSRNSRSIGKTDFWTWASAAYGASLLPGQGLTGLYMPGDATPAGPQAFAYDATARWFEAAGIPITPTDDAGRTNPYPLLRIGAADPATGASLSFLDVVVPVAQETECRTCHRTGGSASVRAGVTWSTATDGEVQAKQNVLKLHDAAHGTRLFDSQPVLCASCHYSPALDLAGAGPQGAQKVFPWFSRAIHGRHDFLPGGAAAGCYQCHPGAVTQCARGPMITAGMECRDCHGDMAAVAGTHALATGGSLDGAADGASRRAWTDLPRCQSCHTGDATSHLSGPGYVLAADGIRLRQAWKTGDAAASPVAAAASRFAENPRTLYRFSKGHGGLLCQSCHGSTHAEWPVADAAANDNVAARQLQGHEGVLIECATCHGVNGAPMGTGGPHGMHPVGDSRWANGGHERYYSNACKACHGATLDGTDLSVAHADRPWGGIKKGDRIGCNRCHGKP